MDKKVPKRTCVGCGTVKDKAGLVRIVLETDSEDNPVRLWVDETGRMKGRGAYLCGSPSCMELAIKKKAFNRAYKMAVPEAVLNDLKDRFIKVQEAYETK